MGLQVFGTKRHLTLQTGFKRPGPLVSGAAITYNFQRFGRRGLLLVQLAHGHLLELVDEISECPVDAKMWLSREPLHAERTLEDVTVVPVGVNADLAEVVSAGSGDRVHEDIQADGTLEVGLEMEDIGGGHIVQNTT